MAFHVIPFAVNAVRTVCILVLPLLLFAFVTPSTTDYGTTTERRSAVSYSVFVPLLSPFEGSPENGMRGSIPRGGIPQGGTTWESMFRKSMIPESMVREDALLSEVLERTVTDEGTTPNGGVPSVHENNARLDTHLTPYVEPDLERILPLFAQHSTLPYRDLEEIVYLYLYYTKKANLNVYVVLAQAIHETGWFTSWWSHPPRRNLAGLGVSGEVRCTPPTQQGYVAVKRNGKTCWLRGYTYATWDDAVRSHVAWVLYYTVGHDVTEDQFALLQTIGKTEGVARVTQITDFNGLWAVPGTRYGQRISRIARLFLECAQECYRS